MSTSKKELKAIPTGKPITPEQLNKYVDACSWGDVPDWGLAIFSYLILDGYLKVIK